MKIGMAKRSLAFQAAHKDAASAVVFRPLELTPYGVWGFLQPQRRLGYPTQAATALAPKITHPAVVGLAQRALALGLLDDRPEKQRRIKHLGFDAELVHVHETRIDAEHLAGFLRGVGADVTVLAVSSAFDNPKVAHGRAFVAEKIDRKSVV